MRYLFASLMLLLFSSASTHAQSKLLETVKRNPKEAIALCKRFSSYNAKGISSTSKEVIEEISSERNLSSTDAEILAIYVIGMHCPEIK